MSFPPLLPPTLCAFVNGWPLRQLPWLPHVLGRHLVAIDPGWTAGEGLAGAVPEPGASYARPSSPALPAVPGGLLRRRQLPRARSALRSPCVLVCVCARVCVWGGGVPEGGFLVGSASGRRSGRAGARTVPSARPWRRARGVLATCS